MRILHVFTVAESLLFLRGQVEFMRERGHQLAVASSPGPGLDAFGRREAVPVFAVPMARRITPGRDVASLGRLIRIIRSWRPHIVHSHTPKGGLLGTTAATLAAVPGRIYHMRGLPMVTARGPSFHLLAAAERTSCALATHVVCNGPSLQAEALSRKLVSASKVRLLGAGSGNGIDSTRFDPEAVDRAAVRAMRDRLGVGEAPLVGFVGRLVVDKGVVELAEAWARLRARRPEVHLVVAGVFEERDAVPADVRARLVDDPRVHLVGFVEDTPTLFAALDVLAFPSHREGFPNVPAEAGAMRLPVVGAEAVGTVDAVVDGVTGTLVPVGDAVALADAIERYLADPGLAARHGAAARERIVREFACERVWASLDALYREIASASPNSGGRPWHGTQSSRRHS